jgi:hypothetical protein
MELRHNVSWNTSTICFCGHVGNVHARHVHQATEQGQAYFAIHQGLIISLAVASFSYLPHDEWMVHTVFGGPRSWQKCAVVLVAVGAKLAYGIREYNHLTCFTSNTKIGICPRKVDLHGGRGAWRGRIHQ